MTREEAIAYYKKLAIRIKGIIADENEAHKDRFFQTLEATNMAINALQTEPCEDAISRSELLKAIDTWDKFGVDDTNSLFRLDNLSLPHYVPYIHYDDVVKCIKSMPSVTAEKEVYSTDAFWKMIDDAVDKMEVE